MFRCHGTQIRVLMFRVIEYTMGPSGIYPGNIDVGNVTTGVIPGLADSTIYWIALTAYNAAGIESQPSSEISYTTTVHHPDTPRRQHQPQHRPTLHQPQPQPPNPNPNPNTPDATPTPTPHTPDATPTPTPTPPAIPPQHQPQHPRALHQHQHQPQAPTPTPPALHQHLRQHHYPGLRLGPRKGLLRLRSQGTRITPSRRLLSPIIRLMGAKLSTRLLLRIRDRTSSPLT